MSRRMHRPCQLARLLILLACLVGAVLAVIESEEGQYVKASDSAEPAALPPVVDRAREAERLYASSMKILATLKARSEAAQLASQAAASSSGIKNTLYTSKDTVQGLSYGDSTLLRPVTETPLLDYLEEKLSSRTSFLARLLRLYRRMTGRWSQNHASYKSAQSSKQSSSASPPTPSDKAKPETSAATSHGFMGRLAAVKNINIAPSKRRDSVHNQQTRAAAALAVERLEKAYELGKIEAGLILADLYLWGRYSLPSNATEAYLYYSAVAGVSGDPYAQYMTGFLHSTNYGTATSPDTSSPAQREGEGDQGAAILHYTFAALAGQAEAEMTMGYRHWVGVGAKQQCQDALPWYKSAADKSIAHFKTGPPGGRHLPPQKLRLADVQGGAYGPGASATTSGHSGHHHHHSHSNHHHPTTEREWEDVLEFYHFHAERGDASFMFRIGRIYYQGFNPIASRGGGSHQNGGRDFARALRWFTRIARTVWPRDPIAAYVNPALATPPIRPPGVLSTGPARQSSQDKIAFYDVSKDVKLKVEDHLAMAAGLAAGYLGRMYLRGEGFPEQDYARAFLWFQRGIGQGDRESHNGLGIMYRDGLGVPKDSQKALSHFQTAAAADHAEAQVNLGKYHFYRSEYVQAATQFEAALRHGDGLQAYYYLAEINSHAPNRPDLCPIATAFYKIVAERGDWLTATPWWEAELAWSRGDAIRALLGYWVMAERGYEVAQNNVAWILDQDKQLITLPFYDLRLDNITERLALIFWTRSAAQDNFDALVKMGDYYLKGLGVPSGIPQPEKAAACYASAANSHVSSLAMHNLGWMHENGIGVSQDFHLAKRYYDLSLETNNEAYLPVTLSILKLQIRSLYKAIIAGDIKAISLFVSNDYEDSADNTESGDASAIGVKKPWLWSWRRLRDEFFKRWVGEEMARQEAQRQIQEREAGIEGVAQQNTATPGGEAASTNTGTVNNVHAQKARASLEAQDDPVEWARRQRDDMLLQAQQDEFADDLETPDFFGDTIGGRGIGGGDDLLETVAIIGLCLVLGWLVYIRQARYDGARAQRPPAAAVAAQAVAGAQVRDAAEVLADGQPLAAPPGAG